jgi:sodium transport system permease protein
MMPLLKWWVMMFRNIGLVYRKELLDTVRDRRTILSMIIIPILIFPLLTIGFSSLIATILMKSKAEIQKVAIVNSQAAPELREMIAASGKVQIVEVDSVEASILRKDIRAAVVLPDNFQEKLSTLDSTSILVLSDESETKSEFAAQKLETIIGDYRKKIIEGRLAHEGLSPQIAAPFKIENKNVASKEKMGSFMLSLFLPYMIIILSMTGAMYTAMDLTAGEKERGTMETILVSPIPRWQLATGKFITILTASVVTTLLSILSMTGTMVYAMSSSNAMMKDMSLHIQPISIIVIGLLMIPTASMFAALLMSVSLSAKTYKEAQSYVSPLMMVVIMPALVSVMPGVELNLGLSFVPLVNVSLCIKEAMMGNVNWLYIGIIFFSTVLLAAAAIFIAHRLFEKESILFNN